MRKLTTLSVVLLLCTVFIYAQDAILASADPTEKTTVTEKKSELKYQVYNPKDKSWTPTELDRNPEPNGGEENFWNIVNSQMMYPDKAQRAKLEGDVIITMTIDKKGRLAGLALVEGLGLGCEEEAFRALQIAGTNRFIPAMKDGEPVTVKYDISIGFYMK